VSTATVEPVEPAPLPPKERRMRAREKLTNEEKVALALDVLKRARPLHEICAYYQVSHTTAYNIRNTFLEGGRRALAGESDTTDHRLRTLETAVARHAAMIEQARDKHAAES
jgi:transposase-like protein